MREEFDEIDDTLDDIEPINDGSTELYEHFRVVVIKGNRLFVLINIFLNVLFILHEIEYKMLLMPDL